MRAASRASLRTTPRCAVTLTVNMRAAAVLLLFSCPPSVLRRLLLIPHCHALCTGDEAHDFWEAVRGGAFRRCAWAIAG